MSTAGEKEGGKENKGRRTKGSLDTASADDAASSIVLQLVEALAGTLVVSQFAGGDLSDGDLEAVDGARGDLVDGLGRDGGDEGSDDESELHFGEGFCVCLVSLVSVLLDKVL